MTNELDLGKLEKVPIKKVWPKEPYDFTPWLANHIDLLADELGLDIDADSLKPVETEVKVGSFSADIVAQDNTGNKIVIENQYGNTDHDHLGKVITYAAGIDAKTIVWVSENIREEHQKTIEFLNNNTTDTLNFFLVQIEAYKIGDSKPAPKFNLIEGPNEWARAVRGASGETGKIGDLPLIKLNFWQQVRDLGMEKYPGLKWRKASKDHWYDMSVGSRISHISMQVNSKNPAKVLVSYEFWPHSKDKSAYDFVFSSKSDIEAELNQQLIWDKFENKQYSKISAEHLGNYREDNQQKELVKWIVDMAEKFSRILPKYDETVGGRR